MPGRVAVPGHGVGTGRVLHTEELFKGAVFASPGGAGRLSATVGPFVPKTAEIADYYWVARTASYATACANSSAKCCCRT